MEKVIGILGRTKGISSEAYFRMSSEKQLIKARRVWRNEEERSSDLNQGFKSNLEADFLRKMGGGEFGYLNKR
jgi:hypothetical protein